MLSKVQIPIIKLQIKLKINRLRMKLRKCKRNTKRKSMIGCQMKRSSAIKRNQVRMTKMILMTRSKR